MHGSGMIIWVKKNLKMAMAVFSTECDHSSKVCHVNGQCKIKVISEIISGSNIMAYTNMVLKVTVHLCMSGKFLFGSGKC